MTRAMADVVRFMLVSVQMVDRSGWYIDVEYVHRSIGDAATLKRARYRRSPFRSVVLSCALNLLNIKTHKSIMRTTFKQSQRQTRPASHPTSPASLVASSSSPSASISTP